MKKLTAEQLRAKPAGMKLEAYVKLLETQPPVPATPTPETKAAPPRAPLEPFETATIVRYSDTYPDGSPVPGRWEFYEASPDPAVNRGNFPDLMEDLKAIRVAFGDETLTFSSIRIFIPDDITSAPVLGRPRAQATS